MKRMLVSIIVGSLLLVTPVQAQNSMAEEIDQIIQLCKMDRAMFRKGVKGWLQTELKKQNAPQDMQIVVKTICYSWGRGLMDGYVEAERRNV